LSATKVGIRRISYLSGAGVSPTETFPVAQAKWQAEEAIRESGVPFTIWRATWFMETLLKLVRFGIITVPGSGNDGAHWVAGDDLGRLVSTAFRTLESAGKALYVFGPRYRTLMEAARIFRDIAHPGKRILKAPLGVMVAVGSLIPNREMWFGAQMMRYLNRVGEPGDPDETNRLLGAPEITIEQFSRTAKA
jgi:uncharacterized protein YbjT (DUF2867 family)